MTEVLPSRSGEGTGADADVTPPPATPERKAPFSRRAVAPVGVTPPQRTGSGQLAGSAPAATFAPAPAATFAQAPAATFAPAPAATFAQAPAAAREPVAQPALPPAADRPGWFGSQLASPAVVPGPGAGELATARHAELARQAAWEEQRRAHQAADEAATRNVEVGPAAEAPAVPLGPPTPVVPPIVDTAAVPHHAPDDQAPANGRRRRLKRGARLPAPVPVDAEQAAAETAAVAQAVADNAALEAYRRYAREGTMISEDYYRGQVEKPQVVAEPTVVIAESLIPTGRPRLARRPGKPRGPRIVVTLVVLALAGGGYLFQTHRVAAPVTTGLPNVTLDETTSTTGGMLTVPVTATSGQGYHLLVPAGWRALSSPTRAGGAHLDVTVTEPVLGLSVTVHSQPASSPDTVIGTPVDSALRVFGHPAGIIAPTVAAGSSTVSRVATVTRNGVRYAVTLTVPRESAARDYARAATVARSLTW